jgi:hypothetical protein
MNQRKSNLFGEFPNKDETKKQETNNEKPEFIAQDEAKQTEALGIEKNTEKNIVKEEKKILESKIFGDKKSSKETYPTSSNNLLSEEEKGKFCFEERNSEH